MKNTITREFIVPASHPSLAGHFPGQPVVPAVVLLDNVLAAIQTRGAFALRSIAAAKFLQPVLPDERIELHVEFALLESAKTRASFRGTGASAVAFEGSFVLDGEVSP
jgi:3-hydroxymyristoyl/3-hydroxydecanoyl-(acyl carrier protein) dehydratase